MNSVTHEGGGVRAALLAADPGRRQRLLSSYLKDEALKTLEIDLGELGRDEPLDALSIDSVAVLDFKNRVEDELGVSVPVMDLVEGITLEQLESTLMTQLTKHALRAPGAGPENRSGDGVRSRAADRRRALGSSRDAGDAS